MARARSGERAAMVEAVGRIAKDLAVSCAVEEPLGPRTTMGVGGPAPCFLEPATAASLAALLRELTAAAIPFRVLGAGSNVIVDDAGIDTPVVSTGRLTGLPTRDGATVWAPAGSLLPKLVRQMASEGLGGFEHLEGIPGNVGGAIRMNAGAGGRWIGDVVVRVDAVTAEGVAESSPSSRADFGYRRSFVSERGLIVTGALLRGELDDPETIRERIRDARAYRVSTQPLSERSSGCVFKNPPGGSAGAMLDRLSLKGLSIGGAVVSEKHANFIVNRGGTCADILALIAALRERVRRETGVELELEVVVWKDR